MFSAGSYSLSSLTLALLSVFLSGALRDFCLLSLFEETDFSSSLSEIAARRHMRPLS